MQTAMCAFIAFAVTALSGIWFIPLLKKIKFGQTILEIGPSWHKNKQGTPTMGGLMFITGIVLACCARFFLYISGTLSTVLKIPFIGQIDLGILYYPVAVFIIVGASNAVNLTDGIDGLCSGVSFVCACGFMVMATILGHSGMTYLAAALAGGCAGFFLWNCHPARVFMGDTGSLFIGGMVCALAFGIDYPVILVFAGIVYVIETLSDIIQIGSYKLRHKRVFKMAPIHHHFEMCGWSEWKIVIVFSFVMLIGAVISVLAVKAI